MSALHRAALALALLSPSGCYEEEPSRSADVATADMRLYIVAEGTADATRLTVDVLGPAGNVELVGGDVLRAGATGSPFRPSEEGALVYEAALSPGVVSVDVELARVAPHDSARFAIELPARAELLLPAVASRSQPLRIEWEPGPGTYTSIIHLGGDCFTQIVADAPTDPGSYVVQPDALEPSAESCVVTVTLTRTRNTTVSAPPLDRVDGVVSQVMSATFESRP